MKIEQWHGIAHRTGVCLLFLFCISVNSWAVETDSTQTDSTAEPILVAAHEMPTVEHVLAPSGARGSIRKDFGPLVSNVFFETDLRQALQDLASQAEMAILSDNTVQGLVTLEFNDVPLEKILKKILSPGGYVFKKIDDYYLVGTALPDNPSFHLFTDTEYFSPDYLLAEQIPQLLPDFYLPYIRVNDKTNSIAITAPVEIMEKIKSNIHKIDIAPQQISIEAIVAEISNDASRSLGIDWDWLGSGERKDLRIGTNNNTIQNDSSFVAKLIKTGINYKGFNYDVIYSLKAMAAEGKARVRANPKITAINGKEATIFIGQEQFFSIVTGPVNYPYARVERIPVGISLKIVPRVSSKDEITADIEAEVSEVTAVGASGLPLVTKRKASTNVRVKDGEKIAIGGLVQETEIKQQKKIPLLGSIPILGYLFSHTSTQKVEKEIVIFISPHIVTD